MTVLLAFVLHSKPKVRKAAQKAVALIVNIDGIAQAAVDEVAKFCDNELQKSPNDTQVRKNKAHLLPEILINRLRVPQRSLT